MNLMKFKGADDAVKLTIRLSAGYCIILTIAFACSIIFLINKIEKAYGQALVIDRQGEVYEASSLSASDMRQHISFNKSATSALCWLRTTLKFSFVIYPSAVSPVFSSFFAILPYL